MDEGGCATTHGADVRARAMERITARLGTGSTAAPTAGAAGMRVGSAMLENKTAGTCNFLGKQSFTSSGRGRSLETSVGARSAPSCKWRHTALDKHSWFAPKPLSQKARPPLLVFFDRVVHALQETGFVQWTDRVRILVRTANRALTRKVNMHVQKLQQPSEPRWDHNRPHAEGSARSEDKAA